jgi:cation diffusion facilitator CzcD-associated flavoprotein CzcO
MLDCVIIGGGIHGTYLSNLLVTDFGLPISKVKIIDPNEDVCGRWKELTSRTGMQFLRSPIVHNVGTSPWDLLKFFKANPAERWARTIGATERPSLAMFNAHVDAVCDNAGLRQMRVKAQALAIHKIAGGLQVVTTAGTFETRRVILAISSNDKLEVPAWAANINPIAQHIFAPSFDINSIKAGRRIAVVGAGITAAQVALRMAEVSPGRVSLIVRKPLKVAEFDADSCWMGPKCLNVFAAEKNYAKRRELIKAARNKGTVTPEIYREVRQAERQSSLKVIVREVDTAHTTWYSKATLVDAYANNLCHVSHVILATGFVRGRPGGDLVNQIVRDFNMPVAGDGFPSTSETLLWKDNIYVTGALAELEVGPPARNILGARLAGERLRRTFRPRYEWQLPPILVAQPNWTTTGMA